MRFLKYAASAAVIAVVGTTAYAQTTNYSYKITYYSTPAKTVVVGRIFYMCDGTVAEMGIQTPYYTDVNGNCP